MRANGKTYEQDTNISITSWIRGNDGDSEYDYDYDITVKAGETAKQAARRLGIKGSISVN